MNTFAHETLPRLVQRAFTKNEWALLSLNTGFLENVGKLDSPKSAEAIITSNALALLTLGRLEPLQSIPRYPPRPRP